MNTECTIGIDEVGRGPIAGPVAVCAFIIPDIHRDEVLKLLEGIKDSKKLSEKKRQEWADKLTDAQQETLLDFSISFINSPRIDEIGIAPAIREALKRALEKHPLHPKTTRLLLDGGLKAPGMFENQETIVKGEDVHPEIAAASVLAKVARDKRMHVYDKMYPPYGFARHKGYGTVAHYEALGKYGPCSIHRRSFLST